MGLTTSTSKLILANEKQPLQTLWKELKSANLESSRFFILTDNNTHKYCLPAFFSEISTLQNADILQIENGEENKNIATAEKLWESLLNLQADRNSILINLGGGMASDIGGFVAASYKRGIGYVNIPTTLLAMVDAAIGGKTAVNLAHHKNQIGFFHQPLFTCLNPKFLQTLNPHELTAGVAEMYKTALIFDASVWRKMEAKTITEIAFDINLIDYCAMRKEEVTKIDPYEKNLRKILNFGHSIGHAIESVSLENETVPLLHGESVALGMVAELYLSVCKLNFPVKDFEQISCRILRDFSCNSEIFHNIEQLLGFLRKDKKNSGATIKMSLLKTIGNPAIDEEVSEAEVIESILDLQQRIG